MIALIGLLIIVVLSLIVVRIGATALELTGLSPEIASFQAQSAFSGVGFTTAESETIVTHPVRRRIIRILILLGSAGVTTSIATLVLTFVGQTGRDILIRALILLSGLLVILLLSRSRHISYLMKKVISGALKKWTTLRIFDYEQLLGFSEGFTISRVKVRNNSRLCNKKLSEIKLEQKGILILGIYRKIKGKEIYIGGLTGDSIIHPQDILICYSREEASKELSEVD